MKQIYAGREYQPSSNSPTTFTSDRPGRLIEQVWLLAEGDPLSVVQFDQIQVVYPAELPPAIKNEVINGPS